FLPGSGVKAAVVLGGPMNVDEVDEYPYLGPLREWLAAALRADLPLLGVCLGAQLMASALGAAVRPGEMKEIGFHSIELSEEGKADPLLNSVAADGCLQSFQWHGDGFEIPQGAVRLAGSGLFPNQAFRYGRNSYALQFHLEVTEAMALEWLELYAGVDPAAIREQIPRIIPQLKPLAQRLFREWLARCQAPVPGTSA
ncbi:MAG: glutamine amidotransferase, partial [Candidatus Omnitrophica bacterium]|nr:glutamine amidotransferase [Candidatus Omnitrophota bacterium]